MADLSAFCYGLLPTSMGRFHFPPMVPSKHHIFRQPMLPPIQHTDETIAVLTFCANGMYYHWMFDVVSRLDLLNRSGMRVDRYIVNGVRHAFQVEVLELLGIPKEKLIPCYESFHLQVKKLIVPAAPPYNGALTIGKFSS